MRVPANIGFAMRDNRGDRDDWDLCKRRRVIARVEVVCRNLRTAGLKAAGVVAHDRNESGVAVGRQMLLRAISAFIVLPGMVAFAIPIGIGASAGNPVQHSVAAAAVVCAGTVLLLWCVREFYVAGRGYARPLVAAEAPGGERAVPLYAQPDVRQRHHHCGRLERALGLAHAHLLRARHAGYRVRAGASDRGALGGAYFRVAVGSLPGAGAPVVRVGNASASPRAGWQARSPLCRPQHIGPSTLC